MAEIKKLTRQFEDGFNSKNLDKMMSFYADKYVEVNLANPVQTREERREYYKNILKKNEFTIRVKVEEVIISGNHGFVRGEIDLTDHGNNNVRKLRYIEIWKKRK